MFDKIVKKIRANDTRKQVIQGPQHKNNITNMFREIIKASWDEFTEDNDITLEDFLDECYEDAKKTVLKHRK